MPPATLIRCALTGKQGCDHRSGIFRQTGAAECGVVGDGGLDHRIVAHHAAAEAGRDRAGRHDIVGDAAQVEALTLLTRLQQQKHLRLMKARRPVADKQHVARRQNGI